MWQFPKRRVRISQPTDIDDINDNFREIQRKAGALNEHDFIDNAFPSKTDVELGASIRVGSIAISEDPGFTTGTGPTVPGGASVEIPNTKSWAEVLAFEVQTESSPLWMIASFTQLYITASAFLSGLQFALEVDGSIIYESMTGKTGTDEEDFCLSPKYNRGTSIDCIVPVVRGNHIVRLVGRRVGPIYNADERYFISSGELICIELRR